MRRRLILASLFVAVALLSLIIAQPALAKSKPSITGNIQGIELCPQDWCGSAIFIGLFVGEVDGEETKGVWWVAAEHQPLPEPGDSARITGGSWGLRAGEDQYGGTVLAGSIHNNGNDTYLVQARLKVHTGGKGTIAVEALLDHNYFPPIVDGSMSQ